MKKITQSLFALIVSSTLFLSCSKDPDHSIRIKNSFPVSMSEVKINSTSYGRVATGSTSGYKPVDEGSFTISGSTETGLPLSGSGSVKGKGTHKWTVLISSAGSISISED